MKKLYWIMLALLAFTACGSDDDEKKAESLTVEKVAGLWMADYTSSGTDGDLHWTRVLEDYNFNADGTGYYECYLIDGSKLVGAENVRDNGALHYTISGNTVTVTLDATGEKWTLTYADGKLTDPKRIVFQRATAAQQAEVEEWYADWQGMNSGEDGDDSTIRTGVTDDYTDEPARARSADSRI